MKEKIRDFAMIMQQIKKFPKVIYPLTLMTTYFMVPDANLKTFFQEQASLESLNTLYEYISIISTYSKKRNLFVQDNEDVVLCNEELFRAINIKGLLWNDLPHIILKREEDACLDQKVNNDIHGQISLPSNSLRPRSILSRS